MKSGERDGGEFKGEVERKAGRGEVLPRRGDSRKGLAWEDPRLADAWLLGVYASAFASGPGEGCKDLR